MPECFDLFFAGIGGDGGGLLGYDDYECDYFGFDDLNTELSARLVAEERLLRMTKKELLDAAGQCLRIAAAYLGLKTRYDDLSDALAIIRAENDGLLDAIRKVSAAYEDAEKAGFQDEKGEHFDKLLFALPAECWLR